MKICKFCGNKMEDNDNYCENCGARYTENDDADGSIRDEQTAQGSEGGTNAEKQNEDNAGDNGSGGITNNGSAPGNKQKERTVPKKEKGLRSLNKKALGVIAGAAAVIVILVIFVATRRPTIDLNDYAEFNVSGYDGYGSILANVDYEQMLEDHADIFSDTDADEDELESLGDTLLAYDDAVNAISITVAGDSSDLSNGDTVTCTWDIPESVQNEFEDTYHCRLRYSDIEYEVTGLEEIEEVDPFDEAYFSIEYSGMGPNGRATATNSEYNDISYEISPQSGLSNGDTITITATMTKEENVTGFTLSKTSADFTVDGLDSYVSDLSEIPDDYLAQMEAQSQDEMTSEVSSDWDNPEWYQSMEYIGSYLAVQKPDTTLFFSDENTVYMIYKVTADSPQGDITYYTYAVYGDVVIYADGTCYTDLARVDMPNRYEGSFDIGDYEYVGFQTLDELYNQVIAPLLDKYTVTDNIED